MNWFLEWLDNVKSILEMDSNSFYPMLVPCVIPALGLIKSIINEIKEKRRRKIFELYRKSEGDNFYLWVMGIEFFVSLGVFFVIYFFCEIVRCFLCLKGQLGNEWKAIIVVILSFVITMALTRMTWMRKRLLGDKIGKRIVVCSISLFNMFFMCVLLNGEIFSYLGHAFGLIYVGLEGIGLLYFFGRYIKYDFSSMKLYLDNGEMIICEDIEKVRREKGYIGIETKGKNTIVEYEKIWKVEYYGLPKIFLKEDPIFNLLQKLRQNGVPIFGRKRQTNGK